MANFEPCEKKRCMYFSSKDNLVLSCYVFQKLIGIKTSIDINDEFLVLPCRLLLFFFFKDTFLQIEALCPSTFDVY